MQTLEDQMKTCKVNSEKLAIKGSLSLFEYTQVEQLNVNKMIAEGAINHSDLT